MKIKPTIAINLHCEEGRAMTQLDLSGILPEERTSLCKILDMQDVEFGVGIEEDGRMSMKFIFGVKAVVN